MKKKVSPIVLQLALLLTTFILTSSSSAQWVRRANAFQFRSDLSESVVYNSKLYTFFGFMNPARETEPTSEAYDPATDTYTLLAPIPDNASMTHQRVILVDNTVWIIGGRVGKNPGPLTSAVWIYNITTNSWKRGPQLQDPATAEPLLWAAGGAALLGRTLHLFGGFIINGCNNDQSAYHLTLDIDTWLSDTTKPAEWKNELAPLPIKRNHFSTVVLGGKIYAIGGQFGHDCGGGLEKPYSHVYDPANDTWTELPLLPEVRSHAEGASFAADGKIYIVGGQGKGGKSTDKVTIFDPAGNNGAGTWKDEPSLFLPSKYEGGSAKIIGTTFIYSHGGEFTSASPRKKTYARTINRNPIYKLGFSSGCLSLNADSGSSVKDKTLLFTIDSSKSYTTSSNAAWLTVTKNNTGIATQNAADIEITANTAGLAPGNYNGIITASSIEGGLVSPEATYCVNLTVNSTSSFVQKLEAETAGLNGAVVAADHPDFSGTGFVDYENPINDYIEWSFNNPVADSVMLQFRYSNGKKINRPLQLEVNGVVVSSGLSFPFTGSWTQWSTATIAASLKAGINTVKLTAIGYSGANMDYLAYSTDSLSLPAQRTTIVKSNILNAYVWPNPASGNVRLKLNTSSILPVDVEIIDMLGKTYKKMKLLNPASDINFSVNDLPSGMYIIKVRQGNNLKTSKFIVNSRMRQ